MDGASHLRGASLANPHRFDEAQRRAREFGHVLKKESGIRCGKEVLPVFSRSLAAVEGDHHDEIEIPTGRIR